MLIKLLHLRQSSQTAQQLQRCSTFAVSFHGMLRSQMGSGLLTVTPATRPIPGSMSTAPTAWSAAFSLMGSSSQVSRKSIPEFCDADQQPHALSPCELFVASQARSGFIEHYPAGQLYTCRDNLTEKPLLMQARSICDAHLHLFKGKWAAKLPCGSAVQ